MKCGAIYVSMSFPKPRPPLGSCVTLSGTFLQGYFTDSIQTLHDYSLVQYAVQKGRWLTLTYFSRSQRSNFDLFMVFAYFVKVYCLDSSQTLHVHIHSVYKKMSDLDQHVIIYHFWYNP